MLALFLGYCPTLCVYDVLLKSFSESSGSSWKVFFLINEKYYNFICFAEISFNCLIRAVR